MDIRPIQNGRQICSLAIFREALLIEGMIEEAGSAIYSHVTFERN